MALAAAAGAVAGGIVVAYSMLKWKQRNNEESGDVNKESIDVSDFTLLPPPNPDWEPGDKPVSPFRGDFQSVKIQDMTCAPYDFFVSAMAPRMFMLCSTLSEDGTKPNLTPVTYIGAVSEDEPHIALGITKRKGNPEPKDTQVNIDRTGEFVLNVVSSWCCEAAEHCGKRHGPDVDEFEVSGFTKIPSVTVRPYRAKETAVQMECRVVKAVDLNDAEGVQASRVYIAKVTAIHFEKELMAPGHDCSRPAIGLPGLKPIALNNSRQRTCITQAFSDTKARASYEAEFKACGMTLNQLATEGDPQERKKS